jgi:hypothetical protein
METHDPAPKRLRIIYSAKEMAGMMDMSYTSFRTELRYNRELYGKLVSMGWRNYRRLRKAHVLEIFKVLGYPAGYEHYEHEVTTVKKETPSEQTDTFSGFSPPQADALKKLCFA